MAGNSNRKGAVRRRTSGNPTAGSGGRVRRGLAGKGPKPPAAERPNHKAFKRAQAEKRSAPPPRRGPRAAGDRPEWIVGRNPVVEALRAGVPASALHVAERLERDDRVREAFRLAADLGVPLMEVTRNELDRVTSGAVHQGLAIQIPAYEYAEADELVSRAADVSEAPLLVALDGVTDPRNLGAVVRSAAAFGAHGVVVPERRSAQMTASAWKASAGAALRVPVARVVNLTRTLKAYQDAGLVVVGLDADAPVDAAGLDSFADPVVLVIGSEGKGLSRLVRETCDHLVRIPMRSGTESLNAGVAAGIALYEVARHRS
jgi:23S rRNA (guanosine2251-2'-O)-methyltransferase